MEENSTVRAIVLFLSLSLRSQVPIPTRFLFLMLGPKGNRERYHEVGRSIATLMSDEVGHLLQNRLCWIVFSSDFC